MDKCFLAHVGICLARGNDEWLLGNKRQLDLPEWPFFSFSQGEVPMYLTHVRQFCVTLFFAFSLAICQNLAAADSPGLCLPADRPEWPVCAIYLHGWFGPGKVSESVFEVKYRRRLLAIAKEKGCRIAVPLGDQVGGSGNGYRSWRNIPMSAVVSRGMAACAGVNSSLSHEPLDREPLDMIGFSNGANLLAHQDCETLAQFGYVTLIGPPPSKFNAVVQQCENVRIIWAHEVLSTSELRQAFTAE